MLVLAEEERLEMSPAEREAWLRCCDLEHDNFRTASRWLVSSGDAEWALRLGVGAVQVLGAARPSHRGSRDAREDAGFAGSSSTDAPARTRALLHRRALDIQADLDAAVALGRESCRIYRELGDTQGLATATIILAFQAQRRGHYAEAVSLFGETVSLWTQLGDADRGRSRQQQHGSRRQARWRLRPRAPPAEQVVASANARGDLRGVAFALNGLGDVAASENDTEAARRYHHDSLARLREIDDRWGMARVLTDLASVDLQAGEYAEADRSLREALRVFRELGHQRGVAKQLESLSWCAICQSRDEAAVTLVSAAAAIRQRTAAAARAAEREKIDKTLRQARSRLTAEAYEQRVAGGAHGTLDRVLEIETVAGS